MWIKLEDGAMAPKKAHDTDAAYDIYAFEEAAVPPHETQLLKTGFALAIPTGWYADIRPRSSMFRKGINVSGIIDSGYRGEVMVMVNNNSNTYLHVHKGDRIAQMLFSKYPAFTFEVTDVLPDSDRGTGRIREHRPMMDNVNHPNHYASGGIECIEAIEAALGPEGFAAFCRGNVMKYLWRYKQKNGLEDINKAAVYLTWLQETEKANGKSNSGDSSSSRHSADE